MLSAYSLTTRPKQFKYPTERKTVGRKTLNAQEVKSDEGLIFFFSQNWQSVL